MTELFGNPSGRARRRVLEDRVLTIGGELDTGALRAWLWEYRGCFWLALALTCSWRIGAWLILSVWGWIR